MADDNTDVLMKFVINEGDFGIDAECQTGLDWKDWKDDMMSDFDNGKFFEVLDFGFGMNLADDEGGTSPPSLKGNVKSVFDARQRGLSVRDAVAQTEAGKGASGQFQRWKSLQPNAALDPPYPLKMDEFNFTRWLDKASPIMFERCCNSRSFDSATLVKRKVTGDAKLQAFLRIDFDKVLITKLDWDDGEVIKEKCHFIFRGVKLQYLRQEAHGGLVKARMPVEWRYERSLTDAGGDR